MKLKWFKLAVDLFDNRKIRIVQSKENGDKLVLIWIKLLCLAAKINDGGTLYIVKNKLADCLELSIAINCDTDNLMDAVDIFAALDMIRFDCIGNIVIKNFDEFQWGDGEDEPEDTEENIIEDEQQRKKELARQRKLRWKQKQKEKSEPSISENDSVPLAFPERSDSVPPAFPERSDSVPLAFPERSSINYNIRGEEIRIDKNRIDDSLREERRDYLPPSGREVDCEARRKEPSLSFKCHSATDCESKLYACSSHSLPLGGRGTACGGRRMREDLSVSLQRIQMNAARMLPQSPRAPAPSRREPLEPANSTLCHSATDCEPKPHASSSTAMRSPLPEGAINTPSPQVQKETDKDFLPHTPAGISLAESEYRVCEANISKPSDARLYQACNASPSPSPPPIKEGRGIYKNVFISDKEYEELKALYVDSIDRLIEELSTYLKSSGKSYESHSATLSRWAIRDRREKEAYGGKNGFHNSSECGARQNTPSGDSPKGGKEESRLRYGDFDPEEAFRRAVSRSLATKIGEQASVPPYSP